MRVLACCLVTLIAAALLLGSRREVPRTTVIPASANTKSPDIASSLMPTGSLSGVIRFEGDIPEVEILEEATSDVPALYAENWVVDPETRGVKNVFVYMIQTKVRDSRMIETPKQDVVCEVRDRRFVPHAMIFHHSRRVVVNESVEDEIHHINAYSSINPGA